MFNPKEPLWLPRGSVRGVIALAFTVATIGLVAVTVLRADGELSPALAALFGITSSIVAVYFEKRQPNGSE